MIIEMLLKLILSYVVQIGQRIKSKSIQPNTQGVSSNTNCKTTTEAHVNFKERSRIKYNRTFNLIVILKHLTILVVHYSQPYLFCMDIVLFLHLQIMFDLY